MKKETREKMENLPFEDEEEPSSQK
jgi:hypothetical protein